jgi:hypothetical protein
MNETLPEFPDQVIKKSGVMPLFLLITFSALSASVLIFL